MEEGERGGKGEGGREGGRRGGGRERGGEGGREGGREGERGGRVLKTALWQALLTFQLGPSSVWQRPGSPRLRLDRPAGERHRTSGDTAVL